MAVFEVFLGVFEGFLIENGVFFGVFMVFLMCFYGLFGYF
jgi:hypothetical protein